jgi:hypothetical protein
VSPTEPSQVQQQYAHGKPRPLSGYVVLMGAYALLSGGLVAWARKAPPEDRQLRWGDVARLAVATARLSRLVTKDSVTSPLRAPLTRYAGHGLPSEVNEEVAGWARNRPLPHAVAELVTCPFCMAQWTATGLVCAHVLAPRTTRLATDILVAAAGADAVQYVVASLEHVERRLGRDA